MKEFFFERFIYFIVIVMLTFSLLTVLLINSIIPVRLDFSEPFWNPLSTFMGALLGAGITGVLATNISNKEANRQKKIIIENMDKNKLLLQHYLRELTYPLAEMLKVEEEISELNDPNSDIPIVQIGQDQYTLKYWLEEENEIYGKKFRKLAAKRSVKLDEFYQQYLKVKEIDVRNLSYSKLDEHLNNLSDINLSILSIISTCANNKFYRLTEEEKGRAVKVLENIRNF